MPEVKRRTINGEDYRIMVSAETGQFSVEGDEIGEIKGATLAAVEAELEKQTKKPKQRPIEVSLLGLAYSTRGHMGRNFVEANDVIDVQLRGRNPRTGALSLTVAGMKLIDGGYGAKASARIARRLTDDEKAVYLKMLNEAADAKRRLEEFEKSVGMGDVDALLTPRLKLGGDR
jgi:hypothetical protein